MAVVKGVNDLATVCPELAKEWCAEKNGGLMPDQITAGSKKEVWWRCREHPEHVWQARILNRKNGNGCPFCGMKKVLPGFNDLESQYPEVARRWHPTKNGVVLPSDILFSSDKKYVWQCEKNPKHVWEARVWHMTSGMGCPYCSGQKVLKSDNDLETKNPTLASEWCTEKNGTLHPDMVTTGSNKKVFWKCNECGYIWKARIADRSNGHGCPCCANNIKKVDA